MRGGTAGLLLGTLLVALAARSARAEVIQVRIESIEYAPEKVAAHVGDTIEWVNAGIVAHTATARAMEPSTSRWRRMSRSELCLRPPGPWTTIASFIQT